MQALINGVLINWREAGAGDPAILIHGFPFNSEMWDPQLAAVPQGWRFIAPDLRGFGESAAHSAGPLTMDVFADDVIALMDHLQIDQAVICGASMGGYVSFPLALRYPDRVRALVLSATRAGADSEAAQKGRHSLAAHARVEGSQPVIDSMLPKLLSGHSRLKYPEIIEKVRGMMESTSPVTMARALEGMAQRKDYNDELGKIDAPTLVFRGDLDEIIPAADMDVIVRTVRGARQEVISLAGHLPNLEASDIVNKVLARFLEMLPPVVKFGDFSFSM